MLLVILSNRKISNGARRRCGGLIFLASGVSFRKSSPRVIGVSVWVVLINL